MTEVKKYTKKDFTSSREVKWCPGCGDYAILASIQKTMAELGRAKEQQCVISGIGCSSRFPVYMDTHGFHTIHGRAPTVATGVKVANPELDVWLVTGDGDGLSIGGNHLMHAIRRNLDMVVLLFNNRIYGLTKGQYSPTSEVDKVTKSTPYGSLDEPLNPLLFALSSKATFVARTYDTNPKHMGEVFKAAQQHKGVAFVEILQNCVIFNDATHSDVIDRTVRDKTLLNLEHGEKMIFGKEKDHCLVLDGITPVTKLVSEVDEADILVHDKTTANPAMHMILAQLEHPENPVPMGILRQTENSTYCEAINIQMEDVMEKKGKGNLESLLKGPASWMVEEGLDEEEQIFTSFEG